ncbi:MAG: hypothetical protein A2504_06710 [Bdellovibrionales bacterium RIFOXYD12_FULL_39_22]|nr:MAG: hypothetical protein A2385_09030 [Bdellovibrionales bacterium RIFOXYB1_FULL_39_21]OFZ45158.1 MAG: hypothetical protein A2485_05505 [Bdellovibrionales bacterium RIFOXYC12_FULL_39_17]OFZ45650.1 MAG: hypothetical protein A2404_03610 [Bdellovibrionales bacterium RIFOXYC1_FULL_39_130]OFZ77512.1 MAG: hypothetical protein A2560_09200 [Bdellovibrionales bacterium RIFOXYD1_FULL_39_84]OFZ91641.1 MAG: hypothetical protein A2504_06710 [Bdellovibrionales bacterium RIFOXYD12_FULL_39_22]HLE11896.1 ty
MKKGFFRKLFTCQLAAALACVSFMAGAQENCELLNIDFKQQGEVSVVTLSFDKDVFDVTKQHLTEDKQVIIDIKNSSALEKILRGLDTSEFSGSVVYINPYQRSSDVRVAIQLRDNVRSILKKEGNLAIITIENRFGVFSQSYIDENEGGFGGVGPKDSTAGLQPKSDTVEDILENLSLSGKKVYIGRRISINVKSVSVPDILNMIADASGFNIVMNESLAKLPRLSLSLTNTPWDQVLDTVLEINKLVAKKNGPILLVKTADEETKDLEEKQKIAEKNIKQEPLVTKIFPVSFAEIGSLEKIITPYLTKERGTIAQDKRTNAIIVKDTVESVDRIRKIVEALDTETPQIMIESKIVEVIESHSLNVGLGDGVHAGYDPIGPTAPNKGPGFSLSTLTNTETLGVNILRYGKLTDLKFNLNLMESEGKIKIIQSPKIITQNNQQATISRDDSRYFKVTTPATNNSTAGSVSTADTWQEVSATLSLDVTPQVTNDGSIILKVAVNKGSFGVQTDPTQPPPATTSTINTNVLVDNGSTVVIGGIYLYEESESHHGIPFLKDIPLIGWLFRSSYNPKQDKTELMVFLTPRIMNQENAGLNVADDNS